MSHRLQVLLTEEEMASLREAARARDMTVSEWVRDALRAAREQLPSRSPETKIQAVRSAARHSFPTGDIDQMLREIEQGYEQ